MTHGLEEVNLVCSAHAEVIPSRPWGPCTRRSLLRTRGGDPKNGGYTYLTEKSAPHTRR